MAGLTLVLLFFRKGCNQSVRGGKCSSLIHWTNFGVILSPQRVPCGTRVTGTHHGDKFTQKLVLHNHKSISSHEGTHPYNIFVCAYVVILSRLYVPATRPKYVSPQCVLHTFLLMQHVPAPRVCPPCYAKPSEICGKICVARVF